MNSMSSFADWNKVKDLNSMTTTFGMAVLTTAAVFYPPIATFLDVREIREDLHEVKGNLQDVKRNLQGVKSDDQSIKKMLEK